MKRALILYWHGLGDVIQLTPHLRYLYNKGFKTDLMCRKEVKVSRLLDNCPYVDQLIEVENPWRSPLGFEKQKMANIDEFLELQSDYDWSGVSAHNPSYLKGNHKIDATSLEVGLKLSDKRLEVFIPPEEEEVSEYIDEEFIFCHPIAEFHPYHNWDAVGWAKENLPPLKIVSTVDAKFDNINTAFVLARLAKHRVLASSVFVHACDAMGCVIDAINYGREDRKVWPLDQSRVLHIKEEGKWIK